MRRAVGDDRWEALPDRAQAERRAEGVAFVEEVTDLGVNAPWDADQIDVPVVAMYGELGREHHIDGSFYLAEVLSDGRAGGDRRRRPPRPVEPCRGRRRRAARRSRRAPPDTHAPALRRRWLVVVVVVASGPRSVVRPGIVTS